MMLFVGLLVLLAALLAAWRFSRSRPAAPPAPGMPMRRAVEGSPPVPAALPASGGSPGRVAAFGRRARRDETPRLTQADIAALLGAATGPAEAALRLGRNVAGDGLSVEMRDTAEQLLWHLMDDPLVRVREVIAETLQDSANLPHDLALRLIGDVDSVALPVLRFSPVVLPADLVEVVRSGGSTKQVAIASRAEVPDIVVEALVETENNRAVSVLVANPGAALDSEILGRVAQKFGADPKVAEVLGQHPQLAADAAALLKPFTVPTLIQYLEQQPGLTEVAVARLVLRTLDDGDAGPVTRRDRPDVSTLVDWLARSGRISPVLMRRALLGAEIELYEQGMARRAGISVESAQALIYDLGELGPASLHDRARVPLAADPALRIGLGALRHAAAAGRTWTRPELQAEILQQLSADRDNPCPDEIQFVRIRMNRAA